MNRDDILKWAKEANACADGKLWLMYTEDLERFAELVAEAEREACAELCEELLAPAEYSDTDRSMWDVTCMDCSDAIRARGVAT